MSLALTNVLAACIISAANMYQVPPAAMIGIMEVEGGRIGQQVSNTNGSYDLGPMQVNTLWLPELAKHWKISQRTAHRLVRDNGCVNVQVAAWILHQKIQSSGSLYLGIAHYHSATPHLGRPYAAKVINALNKKGLINYKKPVRTPSYQYFVQR